jgi:hypothetical protein
VLIVYHIMEINSEVEIVERYVIYVYISVKRVIIQTGIFDAM